MKKGIFVVMIVGVISLNASDRVYKHYSERYRSAAPVREMIVREKNYAERWFYAYYKRRSTLMKLEILRERLNKAEKKFDRANEKYQKINNEN